MRTDHRDLADEEHRRDVPRPAHGIPGGSAHLPRLSGPQVGVVQSGADDPPVELVDGGFLHDEVTRARRSREARESMLGADPAATADDGPVRLSFADYSPTESLFDHAGPTFPAGGDAAELGADDDSPTALLGVDPDADWNTIRAAHRNLLARLHPDRFVSADEATRSNAAEQLAAINVAYHELEKVRRVV